MTGEMATGLNNIHDQRMFIARLTETISWCGDTGLPSQPGTSLRTCKPAQDDLTSQSNQVFRVCLERWRRRLWACGKRNLSPVADLCGGRFLAYFPDDNLFDGAAEAESQGFFDVDNIPPYDTWVWWSETSEPSLMRMVPAAKWMRTIWSPGCRRILSNWQTLVSL